MFKPVYHASLMRLCSSRLRSPTVLSRPSTVSVRLFQTVRFLRNQETPLSATTTNVEPEIDSKAANPTILDNASFRSLSGLLDERLVKSIESMGFSTMTPVQAKTVKPILETEDNVVARAKTGTGKTLAFGLPLLEQSIFRNKNSGPRKQVESVIVAPTRDLANQIAAELNKVLDAYYKASRIRRRPYNDIQTVVGGEDRRAQLRGFSRSAPAIVVATPGRLFDVVNEPSVAEKLQDIKYFVLDEADRLLDQGFKNDLLEIDTKLKSLSQTDYRTLLFSATIDDNVLGFAKTMFGKNYTYVNTVDPNAPEAHEKITQSLVVTNNLFESFVAAAEFINQESKKTNIEQFKPMVFLPTVKAVSFFYNLLNEYLEGGSSNRNRSTKVIQFHGQLTQGRRDRAVATYKKVKDSILVTSDVGARGMDFPKVTHVIQIGLPSSSSDYIHRVGRTARGNSDHGAAILFLSEPETRGLKELTKRKVKFAETLKYSDIVSNPEETEGSLVTIAASPRFVENQDADDIKPVARSVLFTLMSYYKAIKSYGLNTSQAYESCVNFYHSFSNDERKPYIKGDFAKSVLGLDNQTAERLFQVSGGMGGGSRGGSFQRNNRSFGDRDSNGGSRSYQRNDRYERNDSGRTFSNDRNDRSSRYGGGRSNDRYGGRSNDRYGKRSNNNDDDGSAFTLGGGSRGKKKFFSDDF